MPCICPARPRAPSPALRTLSVQGSVSSATVRRVTFNQRVEQRQYEIPSDSNMSSNYGARRARASRPATPTISEDASVNSQFDQHIALRNALELQRDIYGVSPDHWPSYVIDGYRAEFGPRPDGPPHYEVPGPPTWVRLPTAVGKREVGYANASCAHCPPWIVDSGATFHAISRDQAIAEGAEEFRKV